MEIEKLCDLIRKDEVCLFIGAGFSAYAGYSLAEQLKMLIYSDLNVREKAQISLNQALSKVAQDFITIRGNRNKLNNILQQEFTKKPISTYNHDQLSRIAFFKTIITTNYDTLIEDSYTNKAVVIARPLDIIVPKQSKTRIFKIHGTIQDVSSLIITDEDYSKLYNVEFNNPFWASVLSELASKHIIFIGYGYEDLNIWAIFQKIFEFTRGQGKSRFFISPHISPLKRKFLSQRNINYYELTSEQFLNGIEENIRKNLKEDIDNKLVCLQTATEVFENYDLKVDLEVAANGNLVRDLVKQSGFTNQQIDFSLAGKNVINKFKKFQEGKSGHDLTFTSSELKDFRYSIEGFDFIKLSQLATLTVQMLPAFSQKCTIKFIDEDFELEDIFYEVYHGNNSTNVVIDKFKFKITIDLDLNKQPKANLKLTIKEPEHLNNINEAIKIYQLANLIFTGKRFNIFFEKSGTLLDKWINTANSKRKKQTIEYYNNKLNIFNTIKKIEKALNLNFQTIDTKEVVSKLDIISNLEKLIRYKQLNFDEAEGVVFTIKHFGEQVILRLKENLKDGKGTLQWIQDSEKIILFGEELNLGKKQVLLHQAYIEEVTDDYIKIKSHLKKHYYRYEVFGLAPIASETKSIC